MMKSTIVFSYLPPSFNSIMSNLQNSGTYSPCKKTVLLFKSKRLAFCSQHKIFFLMCYIRWKTLLQIFSTFGNIIWGCRLLWFFSFHQKFVSIIQELVMLIFSLPYSFKEMAQPCLYLLGLSKSLLLSHRVIFIL